MRNPWHGITASVVTMLSSWLLRSHGRTRLAGMLHWQRSTVSLERVRLDLGSAHGQRIRRAFSSQEIDLVPMAPKRNFVLCNPERDFVR